MEWIQAAEFYDQMNAQQRKDFVNRTAASLLFAPAEVQEEVLVHFHRMNHELAYILEKRLDFSTQETLL